MVTKLPSYIPLSGAIARYAVSERTLSQAIKDGVVRAIKIGEEVAVADEDVAALAVQAEVEAEGDKLVSISEVSRKLKIPISVVWRWQDYGWLPVLATGSRRAKLVSWKRASALGDLYKRKSQRGSRLIPRNKEVSDFIPS